MFAECGFSSSIIEQCSVDSEPASVAALLAWAVSCCSGWALKVVVFFFAISHDMSLKNVGCELTKFPFNNAFNGQAMPSHVVSFL